MDTAIPLPPEGEEDWLQGIVLDPSELAHLGPTDRLLGSSYANTLAFWTECADVFLSQSRYDDAEELLRLTAIIRADLIGFEHPHTIETVQLHVKALHLQAKFDRAETILRAGQEDLLDNPSNPSFAKMTDCLAMNLVLQDRVDEAVKVYETAITLGQAQDSASEAVRALIKQLESLRDVQTKNEISLLKENLQRIIPSATESASRQFVLRSFQRALQTSSTQEEMLRLITGTRQDATRFACRRNVVELGFAKLDHLLRETPTIPNFFIPICSVCANLNPWRLETAAGWKQKLVAGTAEYSHEVEARWIHQSSQKTDCFECNVLVFAMKTYSQRYYSSEDAWRSKTVKIRVKGEPGAASLYVGANKRELIQIFEISDNIMSHQSICPVSLVHGYAQGTTQGILQLLESCRDSHPGCGDYNKAVELPSRLIKVGSQPDDIKLVETSGTLGTYICLSYCWGTTGEKAKTTLANKLSRRTQLPLSELCQTHRDALEIARLLKVEYLWIDALCIVQDDQRDWEKESVRMAEYYSNSMLTIAAAYATHADCGILQKRPSLTTDISILHFEPPGEDGVPDDSPRVGFRIPIKDHHLWAHCVTEQYCPVHPGEIDALPLENRAWCLQERLLSRRIIHFTKAEWFYECVQGRCECGEIGGPNNGAGPVTIREDFAHLITNGSQAEQSQLWTGIVAEMTRRGIKNCSSRLPAVSGIAQRFKESVLGEYLAGLWSSCLLDHLLWSVDLFEPARRIRPHCAPTWSWASVENSSISFPMNPVDPSKACVKIEEAVCIPSSAGIYGSGSTGRLVLSVPLVKANLCFYPENNRDYVGGPLIGPRTQTEYQIQVSGVSSLKAVFKPDYPLLSSANTSTAHKPDKIGIAEDQKPEWPSSKPPSQKVDVVLLAIIPGTYIVGLPLDSGPNSSDTFERIGLAEIDQNGLELLRDKEMVSTVTLV